MKARDIFQGDLYVARISRRFVTVRVDNIREVWDHLHDKRITVYDVTNLDTGRKTQFRSAARFRRPYVQKTLDDLSTVISPEDKIHS